MRDLEYLVKVLEGALLSEQHELLQLVYIDRSDSFGRCRLQDGLGGRESADHCQVHATNDQPRVYAKPRRVAYHQHAFPIQPLGNAPITDLGNQVSSVLNRCASLDQRENRRMHLEILENLLNMAALLGGLGGVKNDSQRDAPLIGIEKRSSRDSIGTSDGHPRDAFIVLYGEARADHTIGQLDGFLDANADSVSFKVREKTGFPAKQ